MLVVVLAAVVAASVVTSQGLTRLSLPLTITALSARSRGLAFKKNEEWMASSNDVLKLVNGYGGGYHFSGAPIQQVSNSLRPYTIAIAAWKDLTPKQKREAKAKLRGQADLMTQPLARLEDRAQQLRGLMALENFKDSKNSMAVSRKSPIGLSGGITELLFLCVLHQ